MPEASPVDHVIGAGEGAELLGGSARGPVVIKNQRVAQISRSATNQFQVCVSSHRDIHALPSSRFADADGKDIQLLGILQNPARIDNCHGADLRNYKQHTYRRSIPVCEYGGVEHAGWFESLEQKRNLVLVQ